MSGSNQSKWLTEAQAREKSYLIVHQLWAERENLRERQLAFCLQIRVSYKQTVNDLRAALHDPTKLSPEDERSLTELKRQCDTIITQARRLQDGPTLMPRPELSALENLDSTFSQQFDSHLIVLTRHVLRLHNEDMLREAQVIEDQARAVLAAQTTHVSPADTQHLHETIATIEHLRLNGANLDPQELNTRLASIIRSEERFVGAQWDELETSRKGTEIKPTTALEQAMIPQVGDQSESWPSDASSEVSTSSKLTRAQSKRVKAKAKAAARKAVLDVPKTQLEQERTEAACEPAAAKLNQHEEDLEVCHRIRETYEQIASYVPALLAEVIISTEDERSLKELYEQCDLIVAQVQHLEGGPEPMPSLELSALEELDSTFNEQFSGQMLVLNRHLLRWHNDALLQRTRIVEDHARSVLLGRSSLSLEVTMRLQETITTIEALRNSATRLDHDPQALNERLAYVLDADEEFVVALELTTEKPESSSVLHAPAWWQDQLADAQNRYEVARALAQTSSEEAQKLTDAERLQDALSASHSREAAGREANLLESLELAIKELAIARAATR